MDLKTGWKTTEFWVAVVSQITGLGLVLNLITPEQVSALKGATSQIVGGSSYTVSRGLAKMKK